MARQSNLNTDGAVRVVTTAVPTAAFVALSNNGSFVDPPVANAEGDTTIDMAARFYLAPGDQVVPQLEGNSQGTICVERISQSQVRVRTWDELGELDALPFALTVTRQLLG